MRIAIIGSGIAGLSAAWLLAGQHDVVLYEANDYAGGHSNTIDVSLDGISHPVDTGFLVHNDRTYPNLIKLLPMLGVETPASEMTFSVSLPGSNPLTRTLPRRGILCRRGVYDKANEIQPGIQA